MHFSDDLFFIRNSYSGWRNSPSSIAREVGHSLQLQHPLRLGQPARRGSARKGACATARRSASNLATRRIREIVIKKRSKNDHIVEGARLLREKRIKVLTTNMIGLPGETLDNALETVELNMG